MEEQELLKSSPDQKRSIKDIVNTPFKKAMFVIQLISYFLIVGSPFIGGIIGKTLELSNAKIGGLVLGIFILGEVLFYGSLFFLGKEIILIIKDKAKGWFNRRKKD